MAFSEDNFEMCLGKKAIFVLISGKTATNWLFLRTLSFLSFFGARMAKPSPKLIGSFDETI